MRWWKGGAALAVATLASTAFGSEAPREFPDASTTGVPPGVELEPSEGFVIRSDGEVVDGLDVTGCVRVAANDVTIRRSRIRCGGGGDQAWPIRVERGARGLVVEDVELDGDGAASVAICCADYTLRRVDIHNSIDGPRMGTNTAMLESYVHDLADGRDTHNDGVQTTGGRHIRIIGNTIDVFDPADGAYRNGAIQTGRLERPLADAVVEGNYLNGGNYTVRGGAGDRDGGLIEGYVFRDNRFGPDFRYGAAQGVGIPVDFDASNVFLDSGEPVVPGSAPPDPSTSTTAPTREGPVAAPLSGEHDDGGGPGLLPVAAVVLAAVALGSGVAAVLRRTR